MGFKLTIKLRLLATLALLGVLLVSTGILGIAGMRASNGAVKQAYLNDVAAATALVAAETPRNRVGWALGVVTSAVALGGAIGPVIGGLAGAVFGLRLVFLGGGILLLLSMIPVLFVVHESPRRRREGPQTATLELIRQRPGAVHSLTVLISAQGLINVCNSATQQLLVLRLLEMLSSGVAAVSMKSRRTWVGSPVT